MVRIPSYLSSFMSLSVITVSGVVSFTVLTKDGGSSDGMSGRWTSSQNSRNNWSIIWSCLVTIFICTWTVFHPNIDIHRAKIISPRVQWFFVGVFMPEFVAIMAMAQFLRIWAFRRQVLRHPSLHDSEIRPWSWVQYFYADMGGFVIEHENSSTGHVRGNHNLVQLSLGSIVQLCNNGYSHLFDMSTDQIKDRSKGDSLAKAITLCQVLWFLAQAIGRAVAPLPITTLELVTVAYVATSAFTLFFWWSKPLDIKIPTLVNLRYDDIDPGLVTAIPELDTVYRQNSFEGPLNGSSGTSEPVGFKQSFKQQVRHVSVPVAVNSRVTPYVHFFLVTLLSVVFGVVHLIAVISGFYFASLTEQSLWLFSSLATTVSPPSVYMLYYAPMQHGKPSRVSEILRYGVLALTVGIYLLSRSYLLVEPFVGLREVDDGVYDQATWTQFWPHVH